MSVRIFIAASAFLVAGCQSEPTADTSTEEPELSNLESDPCEDLQSNLEYSECWQARASEARSHVDIALEQTQQAAKSSDERESAGATDDYRTYLSDALASSQSEWIEFYDHQCELDRRVARGGTGSRAIAAKCQQRLSLQRIGELNELRTAIENY